MAKSYFALRSLDEQVDLTRRTVALREEALELQRKRLRGGVISEFELRQLEAEAAVVRAQLPPLERDREREEVALEVLLGRTPKQLFETQVKVREAYRREARTAGRCRRACPRSSCCADPTWSRPSASSPPPTRASRWRAPRCSPRSA